MKKKLFALSILLTGLITLSSCSLWGSLFPEDTPSVLPDSDGLLVYNNTNEVKPAFSGGGFENQPANTIDIKPKLNYDDLGDVSAMGSIDYMPSTGKVNLLIVPVQFHNHAGGATQEVRQRIYQAYFGENKYFESVRTYFEKSSFGALQLGGVVTDWYKTDRTTRIGSGQEVGELAKEAYNWFKKTYHYSGAEFDSDHDGYVDAICLIYNYPPKPGTNQWAYCYWRGATPGTISNPNVNTFFWASADFTRPANNDYPSDMIDAHTFIHELGHCMGLEDYYNYYDSNMGCTGGFIMQDNNVGDHDPFSKLGYNWVTPTLVTGPTTLTLSSFTETGQVLLFKANPTKFYSPFDEYIAVELYTPTNLNKFDTDHRYDPNFAQGASIPGLRIWHVDSRLLRFYRSNMQYLDTVNSYDKKSNLYRYMLAMSNTNANPSGENGYASFIPEYRQFKLLQSIPVDGTNRYYKGRLFEDGDLFTKGDSFSIKRYSNFFKDGKLNNGQALDFNLTVKNIVGNKATIEVEM